MKKPCDEGELNSIGGTEASDQQGIATVLCSIGLPRRTSSKANCMDCVEYGDNFRQFDNPCDPAQRLTNDYGVCVSRHHIIAIFVIRFRPSTRMLLQVTGPEDPLYPVKEGSVERQ